MDNFSINDIGTLIKNNSYVGRGIVVGKTNDGKNACIAYFIMGRSANSRNRVLSVINGDLYTEPFDKSKVENPNLIIYRAITSYKNNLIVSNGDQTETVLSGLTNGLSFYNSLESRIFEPDAPNFTPRISALLTFSNNDFSYKMNILKSMDKNGLYCEKFDFSYTAINGLGHFIHTYSENGNPIPSFVGEPQRVFIDDDIDEFASTLWNNLNNDNKISLYVKYINLENKETQERLLNKNKKD